MTWKYFLKFLEGTPILTITSLTNLRRELPDYSGTFLEYLGINRDNIIRKQQNNN